MYLLRFHPTQKNLRSGNEKLLIGPEKSNFYTTKCYFRLFRNPKLVFGWKVKLGKLKWLFMDKWINTISL